MDMNCAGVGGVGPRQPEGLGEGKNQAVEDMCFKVSAVLVARGHNPTILHPSFLVYEGIVPGDWELAKAPICTPPFAAVGYKSGFSFVVEQERMQVEFNGDNADQEARQVAEMALKYAEKLPHVRYVAVGINLTSFWPVADPTNLIIERFIKEGPWNTAGMPLKSTRQNFTYLFEGHQLNMTIETGKKQIGQPPGEQIGIIMHGNYHSNLSSRDPLESLRSLLGQAEMRKEHFKSTAKLFLGVE